MDQEIKITAHIEPHSPDTCKFVVDYPIYESGSAYFPSKEKAQGSLLAERLFEIEEVAAVRVSKSSVSITKSGPQPWRPVAGKVAEVIRAHIQSGEPAVSPDFRSNFMPDAGLKNKVQEIFDAQINPAVEGHGGHVELLEVKDNKIYLRMGGACQGCGMADVTLRQGIEATLREQFPQVEEILDVTDHASGANPYYTPSKK